MFILRKTEPFDKWLIKLRDVKGKARILARLKRVEIGNLGDYKSVGGGVFEIRIDSCPGYRLIIHARKK